MAGHDLAAVLVGTPGVRAGRAPALFHALRGLRACHPIPWFTAESRTLIEPKPAPLSLSGSLPCGRWTGGYDVTGVQPEAVTDAQEARSAPCFRIADKRALPLRTPN